MAVRAIVGSLITPNSSADIIIGDETNNTINGEGGNDIIRGGQGADTINGGDGNDRIYGDAGDDILNGNADDDQLYGGEGADDILGGDGADVIYGGDGDDNPLNGDAGADYIYGGAGNDTMNGGTENDYLYGGAGNDTMEGGAGDDNMFGGEGADIMTETSGANNMNGDGGNDTITGGSGVDLINGGSGDDVVNGAAGGDVMNGGEGGETSGDTISYTGRELIDGVSIDLSDNDPQDIDDGVGTEYDTIIHFENITGSNYGDFLVGNSGDNIIDGARQNDNLYGGEGAEINGDTLSYASIIDYDCAVTASLNNADQGGEISEVDSMLNDATCDFSGENDFAEDFENLTGGAGRDSLTGDTNANIINGGAGNDAINGGGGADTLNGDAGDDTITGGSAIDTINGGAGDDTVHGRGGNDILSGGHTGILGSGASEVTTGETNGDTVSYANAAAAVTASLLAGTASVDGDGGEDALYFFENLTGSASADTLTGDNNDNIIEGGAGTDRIVCGLGSDTVSYASHGGAVVVDLNIDGDGTAGNTFDDQADGDDINADCENILGGSGGDTLTGDDGDNIIDGGSGGDQMLGLGGIDTLSYASVTNANCIVTANLSSVNQGASITGVSCDRDGESDVLTSGFENLTGGSGADNLTGDNNANVINGGPGWDSIYGAGGADILYGGIGNNILDLGSGDEDADTAVINVDMASYSIRFFELGYDIIGIDVLACGLATGTLQKRNNPADVDQNDEIFVGNLVALNQVYPDIICAVDAVNGDVYYKSDGDWTQAASLVASVYSDDGNNKINLSAASIVGYDLTIF